MPTNKLWPDEPDYKAHYDDWSKAPSPENTTKLLDQLNPVFDTAINRFAGGNKSPLIRSRAKRLAIDALHTYDPKKGTKLSTHVTSHLQGLRRVTRQQQQILRVPERASMEQAYLHRHEAELTEKLGREPSTTELADYASFSPRKIERLRRYVPAATEGALPEGVDSVASQFSPAGRQNNTHELVHSELDPRDQQIMEWTLGLYGAPKLDNNSIATRLRVSPGAVSQRKAIIQRKLDAMQQAGI